MADMNIAIKEGNYLISSVHRSLRSGIVQKPEIWVMLCLVTIIVFSCQFDCCALWQINMNEIKYKFKKYKKHSIFIIESTNKEATYIMSKQNKTKQKMF